ncbi:MAG: hypothetical protein OXF98_07835 [Rhodospirillaceae bacterium]|nr:hypothetical protein [Rhodospirillaceae bacterium]
MEKKPKPPQAFKRFEQHAHELRAMATKLAILLNGGAAVALLAFVGSRVAADTGSTSLTAFAVALGCFTAGALIAGLSIEVAAAGQSRTAIDWIEYELERRPLRLSRLTGTLLRASAHFVYLAFILFGIGVCFSFLAIL